MAKGRKSLRRDDNGDDRIMTIAKYMGAGVLGAAFGAGAKYGYDYMNRDSFVESVVAEIKKGGGANIDDTKEKVIERYSGLFKLLAGVEAPAAPAEKKSGKEE